MKILVLSDDFPPQSFGGAGIVAFTLAKEMQRRGHEVQIITTVRNKKEIGTSAYENLVIHRTFSNYNTRLSAYIGLWNPGPTHFVKKNLETFKPDVVHAHNVHTHLSYRSLSLAKKSGARVVLTCHDVLSFHFGKFTEFIDRNNLEIPSTFNYRISPLRQLRAYRFRYNPFRNWLIRRILRKSVDHVVAVSHALAQAMQQNGIKDVEVIWNGINAETWRVAPEKVAALKKELGLEDKKVVLFSGRLEGAKGGWELLYAFKNIAHHVSNARLLVLSPETSPDKLKYVRDNGFAEKVIFAGWQQGERLHAAYLASDVVVNPSLCLDTFGLVNIEAMAAQRPLVATCFGGSPEIGIDNNTGYIVNPYNIDILAKKIEDLLTNPEKAQRFGHNGYERVLKTFSLQTQADRYEHETYRN